MDEGTLHRLLAQAYLFEDPSAYRAGVRDAWEAVMASVEAIPSLASG